jgi:hypothetical protein
MNDIPTGHGDPGAAGGPALDHLVFATPDLAATTALVTRLTGLAPLAGGRHEGLGTRNVLLGLGDGGYLEIVGPDPEAPEPAGPRPFGIDALPAARLVTWAVRVTDLDERVAAARRRGTDPGEPGGMARRTPDGTPLSWRLTPPGTGPVPFLIDWGTTPHPAGAAALPVVPLVSFTAAHPEPDALRRSLAALDVALPVAAGPEPALTAVVAGRAGDVVFGADGVRPARTAGSAR